MFLIRWSILSFLFFITSGLTSLATNVGLGTIEQPVNLVDRSDPASIPLGPVVYESNYNYGIHSLISAARPCRHDAMIWERGSETNQNLASVFGIFVEPVDPTQVPYDKVMLRIKAWDKPAYSPYSKEQVLCATLHCLLRSVRATEKTPLRIEVLTEDAKDASWAKKYATQYINTDEKNQLLKKPTPIPGTRLETDVHGVTHVVFTQHESKPKLVSPDTLIAARLEGEIESTPCCLIPIWAPTADLQSASSAGLPWGLFYDQFNAATSIRSDANSLHRPETFLTIDQQKDNLSILVAGIPEHDLAAAIYGIIISLQPSDQKPLNVSIRSMGGDHDELDTFTSSPAWKQDKASSDTHISCVFAIDPKSGQLTKGSLPQIKLIKSKYGAYLTQDIGADSEE